MTMHGQTRDQVSCMRRLVSGGVETKMIQGDRRRPIYESQGRDFKGGWSGIQHAKAMYVEFEEKHRIPLEPGKERQLVKILLFGSANWTLSSRCNHEVSAMVNMSGMTDKSEEIRRKFEEVMQKGEPFDVERAKEARSRSQSPGKIGATQKRWNSARTRKASSEFIDSSMMACVD